MAPPRFLPVDGIEWREWDGEVIAFHAATGDTHLLDPAASAVFLAVQAGETDLAGRVAAALGLEQDAAFHHWLDGALAGLAGRGLLAAAP